MPENPMERQFEIMLANKTKHEVTAHEVVAGEHFVVLSSPKAGQQRVVVAAYRSGLVQWVKEKGIDEA